MTPARDARSNRIAALCLVAVLGACATPPATPPPPPSVRQPPAQSVPPLTTRSEFDINAGMLDTWNAVGQIVVRTPGVVYEGRAQMLGLYSVRYHGRPFLILTRALPLSATVRDTTTRVIATDAAGKPTDSDEAAELLTVLQRELPEEIRRVRARQAEEQRAKSRKARER